MTERSLNGASSYCESKKLLRRKSKLIELGLLANLD